MKMQIDDAIKFYNNQDEEIGQLIFKKEKLVFEGNAHKSARVFFNIVNQIYKETEGSEIDTLHRKLKTKARNIAMKKESDPELDKLIGAINIIDKYKKS